MQRRERNLLAVTAALVGHAAALVAVLWTPSPPPTDAAAISVTLMGAGALPSLSADLGRSAPAPAAPAPPAPKIEPLAGPATDPTLDGADPTGSLTDLVARMIASTRPDFDAERQTVAEAPPPSALPDFAALYAQALAAPPTGTADPCELASMLQAALQADQDVQRAVGLIPGQARSVANAVLLWNGQWADPGALGGLSALAPIRGAVEAGVRAEPADCRDREVMGPRFISLTTDTGTAVLVLGSGVWRWSDLLADASPRG